MSLYPVEPPPRSRIAEIVTAAVLVTILLLLGASAWLWASRSGLLWMATPTPTRTPRAAVSATPDIRATLVAEDMLTQETYSVAVERRALRATAQALATAQAALATQQARLRAAGTRTDMAPGRSPTETPALVLLPIVPDQRETTPVPTPTPSPTALLVPAGNVTPTPRAIGGGVEVSLPIVIAEPAATAAATAAAQQPTTAPTLPAPSPVPSLTPTRTPTTAVHASSLQAVVRDAATEIHIGPASTYTVTATFDPGEEIRLLGRTISGEWIRACCRNNEPGWVRQAYVIPRGNPLESGAPENADPNDVRWLRVEQPSSSLEPLPSPTSIPAGDYPLLRLDRQNRARPPALPRVPITQFWVYPAGQPFTSAVVTAGNKVLAASADRHLYSLDGVGGNQRWRRELLDQVNLAPAIQDNIIYIVDDVGHTYAIADRGNTSESRWQRELARDPRTPFNIADNRLFVGSTNEAGHPTLFVLNRENGDEIAQIVLEGQPDIQMPAIGDQLIYVAGNQLWAMDLYRYNEKVWSKTETGTIRAPPLYVQPGVKELAELYVGTEEGDVIGLDANTGQQIWRHDGSETITGLTVDDRRVYASGNGFVKAIDRENGEQRWRSPTDGAVLGGAITDGIWIVAATNRGSIQLLSAQDGAPAGNAPVPAELAGAVAVSGPWIYAAGRDGNLYGFRESQ